jgi:hypothetical protein
VDEKDQLALIKEFMVAVAPEVAHHRLALIRHRQLTLPLNEDGTPEHAEFATDSARLTLELAMHLAAQYGTCYDSLRSNPYWMHEKDDPPPSQPETRPRAARIQDPG